MNADPIHPPLLRDDSHDIETAANTHPPNWQNPTPKGRYDLIVVGGGTAGLVSAGTGSFLGVKVALIERAYTGGDCLVTGCVPSKALLRCARSAAEVREAARFGIHADSVNIDFAEAMHHVRAARSRISRHDAARSFSEQYGVDVFFGDARFTGHDTLAVDDTALRFRRAIIATGSSPATPAVPGLADAGYYTNETIFNLTERPEKLAVIGGGPLGCELAQAFARLGSRVTLIEQNDVFLHREDPDAAAIVLSAIKKDGVDVRLGTTVESAARNGDSITLNLKSAGHSEAIRAGAVLVAVGRVPNVEKLRLNEAGVQYDKQGVTVDEFLRTGNRRIFAAGDVCLKQKFTHTADASARVAAQNALLLRTKRWSRQIVPHVTYTEPELAQVGPPAVEAEDCKIYRVSLADVDRAVTDAQADGFLKVALNRRSGKIIGATIVGPCAGELVTTITSAMVARRRLSSLADVIVPYPTHADAIKKAADAALQDHLRGWRLQLVRWWISITDVVRHLRQSR